MNSMRISSVCCLSCAKLITLSDNALAIAIVACVHAASASEVLKVEDPLRDSVERRSFLDEILLQSLRSQAYVLSPGRLVRESEHYQPGMRSAC
jgi:hypothetical protein